MEPRRYLIAAALAFFAAPVLPGAQEGASFLDGVPFKPSWSFNTTLTHSQQDGGQVSNDLAFAGTWNASEAGHYLSLGLSAGRKKLEGQRNPFGGLNVGGGLGVGIFTPSLSLALGGGSGSYTYFSSTLGFDLQVARPLSAGLSLSRQVERHSGTGSSLLGLEGLGEDRDFEIGSTSYTAVLSVRVKPLSWFDLSLQADRSVNRTEGITDVKSGRGVRNSGSEGTTTEATAGLGFYFLDDWNVGASYTRGKDRFPDEMYYLPRLGASLDFTGGSSTFHGSSIWVGYSF